MASPRRALGWMEELGLRALLDLHAAPGSQNGYDNSGRRGQVRRHNKQTNKQTNKSQAHWVDATFLLGNRHNLDRTVAINKLVARTIRQWVEAGTLSIDTIYGKMCRSLCSDDVDVDVDADDVVAGFGLLNEPHICGYQSLNLLKEACLQDYYPKGYAAIRSEVTTNKQTNKQTYHREYFTPEEAAVVIDVAGLAFEEFAGRFPETEYQNLVIDAHHYQCFENLAGAQE